jgi:hypothetical protein
MTIITGRTWILSQAGHVNSAFQIPARGVGQQKARIVMGGRANQYLEDAMRWIHTIITILFVTATFLFAAQNLQIVTLSFLGFSARVPVALRDRLPPWHDGGRQPFGAAPPINCKITFPDSGRP